MVEATDELTPTEDAAASLEVETLRERLLTQVGGGGVGPRGSLSKCATKYRDFLNEALAAQFTGSSETDEVTQMKQDLEREVKLYRVEMRKVALVAQAAQLESEACDRQQAELNDSVQECQDSILGLQKIWTGEKGKRRNREEYEALANIANNRPPRRMLQEKLSAVQRDLSGLEMQGREGRLEVAVREKQFQLLLQCILDLKSSLDKDSLDLTSSYGGGQQDDAEKRQESVLEDMDTES